MMQPFMDYSASFCNFDCVACTEICPTGALKPLTLEEKQLTQLGKAIFIKHNCVVHIDGTDCGACSEHCPTKAVYMVPFREDLKIPEVNNDICVGCGACEYACPTDPKSIYVNGNAIHQQAQKPEEVQIESPAGLEDDFPF
jgi:ferredoxin